MNATEMVFLADLRAHIANEYGCNARAAEAWDVSPAFVSYVAAGKKPPPVWLLQELGYQRKTEVMYHKIRK